MPEPRISELTTDFTDFTDKDGSEGAKREAESGKRQAQSARQAGRGEGLRDHGTGSARRLALNALRLPLGARPRLFPWIRGRSFTGNGTGLGPIVEIWGRHRLVGGMWLDFG